MGIEITIAAEHAGYFRQEVEAAIGAGAHDLERAVEDLSERDVQRARTRLRLVEDLYDQVRDADGALTVAAAGDVWAVADVLLGCIMGVGHRIAGLSEAPMTPETCRALREAAAELDAYVKQFESNADLAASQAFDDTEVAA